MFAQVLFVLAAMAATFLLVPRGFSAGEIDIQADKMSWNVRPDILMPCNELAYTPFQQWLIWVRLWSTEHAALGRFQISSHTVHALLADRHLHCV